MAPTPHAPQTGDVARGQPDAADFLPDYLVGRAWTPDWCQTTVGNDYGYGPSATLRGVTIGTAYISRAVLADMIGEDMVRQIEDRATDRLASGRAA